MGHLNTFQIGFYEFARRAPGRLVRVIWLAAFATLVVSGCKVNSIEGSLGTLFPVPPPPFQPVAKLTAVEGKIRNVSSFPIRLEVNFSDVEVTAQHFSLTGGTISNFTRVDATRYEFAVTMTAEGNANIQMELNYNSPDGLILNKPSLALTYDITPPNAPNSVSLLGGVNSGSERSPSIRVKPTEVGDKVALFYDSGCSPDQEAGLGLAFTIFADVKADVLPQDASYLFYAQLIDAAGNKSPCSGQSVAYTLATGLSTNPIAAFATEYTNSTLVDLNLNWIDAKEVAIFTNATCTGIPAWEPFAMTKRRLIGPDDGNFHFSVLFKSATTGATADCKSASIGLDRTGPNAPTSITIGRVATNFSQTPTISWTTTTDVAGGSGIDHYDVRVVRVLEGDVEDTGSDWTNLLPGATISLSLDPLSRFRVYIRAVDKAGNSTLAASPAEFKTPPMPMPQDPRCPANFIPVPASSTDDHADLQNIPEFCVSKHEIGFMPPLYSPSASGTSKLVTHSGDYATARLYCQAFGGDLLTNKQWQILGKAIEDHPLNWSSGVPGTGVLNHGGTLHYQGRPELTDDNFGCPAGSYYEGSVNDYTEVVLTQGIPETSLNPTWSQCSLTDWVAGRRTHILSNGHVIWDIAGNGAEWVLETTDTVYEGTAPTYQVEIQDRGPGARPRFYSFFDFRDTTVNPYLGSVRIQRHCNGVACNLARGGRAAFSSPWGTPASGSQGIYSMTTGLLQDDLTAIRCAKPIAP